jgi:hypothetical protein
LPRPTGRGFDGDAGPDLHGQVDPQPTQRHAAILRLPAALEGRPLDARRLVTQDDARLDLVAMLTAGPAAPLSPLVALGEQRIRGQRGRVCVRG